MYAKRHKILRISNTEKHETYLGSVKVFLLNLNVIIAKKKENPHSYEYVILGIL